MARRNWLIAGLAWVLTIVAILPILLHWTAPAENLSRTRPAVALGYLAALLLCFLFFRVESKRLDRAKATALVILIFFQTHITMYAHRFLVDRGNFTPDLTNLAWQERMQSHVVRLSIDVLPHSYRFLPNALAYWMQLCGVEFPVARDIYQLLAGLVLFYTLYRYARLYTGYRGAILTMALAGMVYPLSFIGYSGQLTDPLSHLSFLLAFIFLQVENFPLLLTTLLIGSVAKETVLGLLGFYVLFCRRERGYPLKAVVLCLASVAIYFGVRLFVLHGSMQYHEVSGVTLDHVRVNWIQPNWREHLLLTAGAYVPFLVLGWKQTPLVLKQMVFYLVPLLFVSSLFFSWLNEARNFMPLVFVLALIAARYFLAGDAQAEAA